MLLKQVKHTQDMQILLKKCRPKKSTREGQNTLMHPPQIIVVGNDNNKLDSALVQQNLHYKQKMQNQREFRALEAKMSKCQLANNNSQKHLYPYNGTNSQPHQNSRHQERAQYHQRYQDSQEWKEETYPGYHHYGQHDDYNIIYGKS